MVMLKTSSKSSRKIKYAPQTRSILRWERKQAIDRMSIGIIIGSAGVAVIYFLLIWLV